MKISETTLDIIKEYCGVYDDESDRLLNISAESAKSFICGYTGLSEDELDSHEELTGAYLIIINDLFTQRDYTLSWQKQINPAASAILRLYAKNYI